MKTFDQAGVHHANYFQNQATIKFISTRSCNCSVAVRRFEERDLVGILRIERESFAHNARPPDALLEYAETAPELFLVAMANGRMAGYVIATMSSGGAEIVSLAVRPPIVRWASRRNC